jgi:hypothetical protein
VNGLFDESSVGFDELPAKSAMPWVWFGFFFALTFLICEFLELGLDLEPQSFRLVLILIALVGWIYWLFCVFRFNTILREISRNHYQITGPEAVGKHFIPLYNLIWIFKWTGAFSDYLNARGRVKIVSGNVIGALLLIGLLLSRFFDAALGLTLVFAVGTYMSSKLRRHIEEIKGLTPAMLPPPPDASMFRAAPTSSRPGPAQANAISTEARRDSLPGGPDLG